MPILLHALLGARRTRLVALISLAVGLVIMLVVFGGLFSIANQIKTGVSDASHAPASAPSTSSAPATAHVAVAYHATPGYREVTGPGFATEYPAGWRHVTRSITHKGLHVSAYVFVSGQQMPDGYEIPPAGEVSLTMVAYPLSAVAKVDHDWATQTPGEFLLYNVGFPKGYKQLGRISPDSASTLDGAPAATLAISYIYHGQGNVQIDTVARHGKEVYFMETDSNAAKAKLADGALGQLMAGWQWR
ncbi:MAG TPA: hypothetical protein VHX62_04985 [Solirubrobacteraceae bacterium]|jgi:hypothetical protein|nr:hypothetical protein [Solirubrobacteraceae bacterium]